MGLADERACVLLIDDDEMVLRAMAAVLGTRCHVETATSPDAALDILTSNRSFRLILCDVNMPGADCIDIYERAVRLEPELAARFVFSSGGPPSSERMQAFFNDPARRLLRKPFRAEALFALIEPLAH